MLSLDLLGLLQHHGQRQRQPLDQSDELAGQQDGEDGVNDALKRDIA